MLGLKDLNTAQYCYGLKVTLVLVSRAGTKLKLPDLLIEGFLSQRRARHPR